MPPGSSKQPLARRGGAGQTQGWLHKEPGEPRERSLLSSRAGGKAKGDSNPGLIGKIQTPKGILPTSALERRDQEGELPDPGHAWALEVTPGALGLQRQGLTANYTQWWPADRRASTEVPGAS